MSRGLAGETRVDGARARPDAAGLILTARLAAEDGRADDGTEWPERPLELA